ncbi:MATE family efflux transporter [Synechococcales cyanobacterium CNB]|nr:MATE family efflux transporter [Synechococcales cyanobacterium CNB]
MGSLLAHPRREFPQLPRRPDGHRPRRAARHRRDRRHRQRGLRHVVHRTHRHGDRRVANAAVGQSVTLAATAGAAVGIAIWLVAGPVAGMLTNTEGGARAFAIYLRWQAAAAPATSVLFVGIACVRGAGDSNRPLAVMAVVNLVNIITSWTLAGADLTRGVLDGEGAESIVVLANPFPFDMGVAGIAVGTFASHTIGAALMLWLMVRGSHGVRLRRKRLRPHWHTMQRLVRVGLPNFFETLGMWAGNFLVLMMVVWLHAAGGTTGAHVVAIRIEAFSFLPGFAISMAAATLAGQYLGAGSVSLARTAVLRCTLLASGIMGVLGLALVAFPAQIVSVLSAQPEHLAMVPPLLVVCGAVQVPFAVAIVLRGALRGAGDTKAVMWITWVTTYGVRLPLAYLLSGVQVPIGGGQHLPHPLLEEPTLTGLWIGLCAEIIARAVVFAWRFSRGGWTNARV